MSKKLLLNMFFVYQCTSQNEIELLKQACEKLLEENQELVAKKSLLNQQHNTLQQNYNSLLENYKYILPLDGIRDIVLFLGAMAIIAYICLYFFTNLKFKNFNIAMLIISSIVIILYGLYIFYFK